MADYTDTPLVITLFNDSMETLLQLKSNSLEKELDEDETMYQLRVEVAIDEALKQVNIFLF